MKELAVRGIRPAFRIWLLAGYFTVLVALGVPAIAALASAPHWSPDVALRGSLLIIVPSVLLICSVTSAWHSLAWSVFWSWSLIFLGLAPAYQLSAGRFPWSGLLREELIAQTQGLILAAHFVVLVAFVLGRSRKLDLPDQQPVSGRPRLRRALIAVIVSHAIISLLFAALMGAALFSGRTAFSAQLVQRATIPGFGTMYFLASAGAIIVPAIAIVLRKQGVEIPRGLIGISIILSFVVTNPLVGSRFLTGSFLVAVVAALIGIHTRRWIPVGLILLFVTVFPTLDLLRGDGTGASKIEITNPSATLLSFDFDSFEMISREMSLHGEISSALPNQVELLIAPFLRWIPLLSDSVQGDISGQVVAKSTGMLFTNVSMPLWGEAHLIGSWAGMVVAFTLLGLLLARTRGASSVFGRIIEIPVAALLFIVLRGSLYEVLGYMLLALVLGLVLAVLHRSDELSQRAMRNGEGRLRTPSR